MDSNLLCLQTGEIIVLKSLGLHVILAFALINLPAHGQDAPALGDLARQSQKDKSNGPGKKVFTNEDLPPDPNSNLGGNPTGIGGEAQSVPAGKSGPAPSPAEQLERLQAAMTKLDSMDQATLAKNILRGEDVNFAGRAKWEEKLF